MVDTGRGYPAGGSPGLGNIPHRLGLETQIDQPRPPPTNECRDVTGRRQHGTKIASLMAGQPWAAPAERAAHGILFNSD
jgi:hypothetical protein